MGLARLQYLRGRQLRNGIDPSGWSADMWLDYIYAELADMAGEVNREEVLERLDRVLQASPVPDPDTWGTDPQAVAEQRAMIALAGGPAPLRPKPTPQPEPEGGDPAT